MLLFNTIVRQLRCRRELGVGGLVSADPNCSYRETYGIIHSTDTNSSPNTLLQKRGIIFPKTKKVVSEKVFRFKTIDTKELEESNVDLIQALTGRIGAPGTLMTDLNLPEYKPPTNFPFRITEHLGSRCFTLRHTLANEKITIDVYDPVEEVDEDDENEGLNEVEDYTLDIGMNVYVTKNRKNSRHHVGNSQPDKKDTFALTVWKTSNNTFVATHVGYFGDARRAVDKGSIGVYYERSTVSPVGADMLDDEVEKSIDEYLGRRGFNAELAKFLNEKCEVRSYHTKFTFMHHTSNYLAGSLSDPNPSPDSNPTDNI